MSLSTEDCECIVKTKLKTNDVSVVDFVLTPYFQQNSELKINFRHEDQTKVLTFFVKVTSNVSQIHKIFDNFAEVLPNFDSTLTPKVHYVKDDLVVFDNLRSQGFENCEFLTPEHIFAALRVLASFHAATWAFEEAKSKSDEAARNESVNFRLDQEHDLVYRNFSLTEPQTLSLIQAVLEDEGETQRTIEYLEERQLGSRFRKALCHGNLMSKNLMFKNQGGAPMECKLINVAPNFYAAPVYDVLQLIFFNTSAEMRQHHWKTFLDYYYECLTQEAKIHNLDLLQILPAEDFNLSAHYFLPLIKLEVARLDDENVDELGKILNCPLLSREDCYVIIKNKLKTTVYKFLSFEVKPLSNVSGFLGQYHKLQIKIVHLSEDTTINCFIKSTPRVGTPLDIATDLNSFAREVFMYETIVPQMQKYGIDMINECIPACYFYRPNEFMVFEDMVVRNFQNLDSMKPLDLDMLTLIIKTLAKFHACSLILEETISKEEGKPYRLIDHYSPFFKEPLFFEDDEHRGARQCTAGVASILTSVALLTDIQTETNQRNFHKFWPKFKELYYKVPRPSDRFRNLLCHGDLWTSNLMAKYHNGKPVSCIFFDFQIVRYSPPVYDLLSVLYLTTHRSTRMEHEDHLLRLYYDELDQILSSFALSLKDFYSYEEFLECFNYIKPHMLIHAACECVLTMSTPEEISSFLSDEEKCNQIFFGDRTELITFMCKKSTAYRNRLKECILDVYDYCNAMCEE